MPFKKKIRSIEIGTCKKKATKLMEIINFTEKSLTLLKYLKSYHDSRNY